MLKGISASPGIAIGKALVLERAALTIERRTIDAADGEIARLNAAIELSKAGLARVRGHAAEKLGEDKAAIFDAHLMVLEDPELLSAACELIRNEAINAEYALDQVARQFIAMFEQMTNEYMRARAADIRDVTSRVLRHLLGHQVTDLATLEDEVILVADDLAPSETAVLDRGKVLGFLTDTGGKTSHSAIMARTLGIPAIVGTKTATQAIRTGTLIAFNGHTGEVIAEPDETVLARYRELKAADERAKAELRALVGQPSVTLDGRRVQLEGNIGTAGDIPVLLRNDAEGIGLFRTEFLYMDRDALPTEEEQFASYREVLSSMSPRPVIIRTLDIGGDKELPYLKISRELNPFLGCRAIRYCFKDREVFRTQLRALLRASVHGELGIMFPMISSLDELLAAKDFLAGVRHELELEGKPVAKNVRVGIMIEIPAAAMISDVLARHCDFFSIGTNDLIQYTCAVDRMNEQISDLYDPCHPAVLRLIRMTIQSAHAAGIPVGMCGEMAGSREFIPLLVGLGLDDFSMNPNALLPARKLIRSLSAAEARSLADEVVALGTGTEVDAKLRAFLAKLSS